MLRDEYTVEFLCRFSNKYKEHIREKLHQSDRSACEGKTRKLPKQELRSI